MLPGDGPPPHTTTANPLATATLLSYAAFDLQVRYEYGERSAAKLKAAGAHVVFNSYAGMQHEAWPEELDAFQEWLKSVLQ